MLLVPFNFRRLSVPFRTRESSGIIKGRRSAAQLAIVSVDPGDDCSERDTANRRTSRY